MTKKRLNDLYHDCIHVGELKLTQEEMAQGWHFCFDWDGLIVGPLKDSEWGDDPERCLCGFPNPNSTLWLELED